MMFNSRKSIDQTPYARLMDNFDTPAPNSLAVARYADTACRETLDCTDDPNGGAGSRRTSDYSSCNGTRIRRGSCMNAYSWLLMNAKARTRIDKYREAQPKVVTAKSSVSFAPGTRGGTIVDDVCFEDAVNADEETPLTAGDPESDCDEYVHSWASMYMMFVSKGLATTDTYNLPLINIVPRFETMVDNTWKAPREIYQELFFVALPIFMAYGAVVSMQRKLKDQFEINFNGMTHSQVMLFEHGTSMNFLGNLIFRLAHNVVLATFKPRERVLTALCVMFCASFSIGFWIYIMKVAWIPIIAICYFLTGCAVGTFEANILSCVTPLGQESKLWMMIGIPVGFNAVAIGGMFAIEAGMDPVYIWFTVTAGCVVSMFIFSYSIPEVPTIKYMTAGDNVIIKDYLMNPAFNGKDGEVVQMLSPRVYTIRIQETGQVVRMDKDEFEHVGGNNFKLAQWLAEWRNWGPLIGCNAGATMIIMFNLQFFICFNLYAMTTETGFLQITWYPGAEARTLSCNTFFGIMAMFQFFADFISRNLVFRMSLNINPFYCSCVAVIGGILCWMRTPALTLMGMFCISFAVGSCYSLSVRHIDAFVPVEYNLIAVSVWLLCGDVGSVTGSNTWQPVLSLLNINS